MILATNGSSGIIRLVKRRSLEIESNNFNEPELEEPIGSRSRSRATAGFEDVADVGHAIGH